MLINKKKKPKVLATVCNEQMRLERKMTFYVKEKLEKGITLRKCKWRAAVFFVILLLSNTQVVIKISNYMTRYICS